MDRRQRLALTNWIANFFVEHDADREVDGRVFPFAARPQRFGRQRDLERVDASQARMGRVARQRRS